MLAFCCVSCGNGLQFSKMNNGLGFGVPTLLRNFTTNISVDFYRTCLAGLPHLPQDFVAPTSILCRW